MANENIGEIDCDIRIKGFIRKDSRNKLYIYAPEYGIIGPKASPFQLVIEEKATMYGTPKADYAGGAESNETSKSPEAFEIKSEIIPERVSENFTPAPKESPKKQPRKIGDLASRFLTALVNED